MSIAKGEGLDHVARAGLANFLASVERGPLILELAELTRYPRRTCGLPADRKSPLVVSTILEGHLRGLEDQRPAGNLGVLEITPTSTPDLSFSRREEAARLLGAVRSALRDREPVRLIAH